MDELETKSFIKYIKYIQMAKQFTYNWICFSP